MSIDGAILQFGGSLVAILGLAGLAYWLKLGGSPRIASPEVARELAREVVFGFAAKDCAVDAKGDSALLADGSGRIMILKRHGSHFAGRILNETSDARIAGDTLVIDSGERRFGSISLRLDDCADWANRINALKDAEKDSGHA